MPRKPRTSTWPSSPTGARMPSTRGRMRTRCSRRSSPPWPSFAPTAGSSVTTCCGRERRRRAAEAPLLPTFGRMRGRRLDRSAYDRPTLEVARDLLGKFIVRPSRGGCFEAMSSEVEAYKGPRVLASHAARGRRTPRVEPLYGAGGTVYVYLVYGLHWM